MRSRSHSSRLAARDVQIGGYYMVRIDGRFCPVEIRSLESAGIWSGVNSRSGKPVYVALRDLLRKVDPPSHAPDWRTAAADPDSRAGYR